MLLTGTIVFLVLTMGVVIGAYAVAVRNQSWRND
jgi:hypothetical protein